jgi:UDP-N-acetylmuramate dehydrogenase
MMVRVEGLEKALARECRGRLMADEPLRNHTSFRVGGPADLLFLPVDTPDLAAALRTATGLGVPVFVMGNGTNLLVRDGGIRGLTIHTGDMKGIQEEPRPTGTLGEGDSLELSLLAGTLLSKVINHSVSRGLSGLEFAAGIPGTVGGATWMNAGAHGSSFGDIVTWARLVDPWGGVHRIMRSEIDFFYRGTRWPREGVIAEVGLSLVFRGEPFVLDHVKHCLSERGKRLPLGVGMAGSVFKNPEGDYAGRVIEAAGLKGLKVGQAEVSKKHANVIVNLGGATARDIQELVQSVAAEVEERTGLFLETEIDIVGEEGS